METQLVTNAMGAPVGVMIEYEDWLKIANQLNLPLQPTVTVKERNPLDWYALTESTNSILTGLIALASREHWKELKKANPDQERLTKLTVLREEVLEINKNTDNFRSLERMDELTAHYGPILLAEKKKVLS